MVKLSFPNMGNSWVAFKALLESIPDVEVVLPPQITRETIDLGAKHSPEFVCFPFKVNVGDFILTHEKYGIDTFVTALDCGPCRFGFYHAVQERILKDLGYNFRIIPLDQADLLEFKWLKIFDELSTERNPIWKFIDITNAVRRFLLKAKYIEDMEKLQSYFRCRELKKGDTDKTMKKMLNELDKANDISELRDFRQKMHNAFRSVPINEEKNPLKVVVTGEIHVTLEPAVNLDTRKKLGELGIEVRQHLSLLDWVLHKFHVNYHRKELERLARPYLKMDIGGEAVWVLGEYLLSKKKGIDGFMHLYPFTCMPEVTARSIISSMDEPKIPALFFSFDEHSGTEGMKTRLEAFMDLMEARRDKGLKVQPEEKYMYDHSILEEVGMEGTDGINGWMNQFNDLYNIVKEVNPLDIIGAIFPGFNKKSSTTTN